jgi:hypothetical protein
MRRVTLVAVPAVLALCAGVVLASVNAGSRLDHPVRRRARRRPAGTTTDGRVGLRRFRHHRWVRG